MSSFSFLFKNQEHKAKNGYYINHDNLMISTQEERQKLIFYFVACQTPEKLDPQDRVTFNDAKTSNIDSHGFLASLALSFSYLIKNRPTFGSSLNPRYGLNLAYYGGTSLFLFYLGINAYRKENNYIQWREYDQFLIQIFNNNSIGVIVWLSQFSNPNSSTEMRQLIPYLKNMLSLFLILLKLKKKVIQKNQEANWQTKQVSSAIEYPYINNNVKQFNKIFYISIFNELLFIII